MITENNQKPLSDISWNVSEKVYRQDHALSYSTLARYEREGFGNLDHLFDHISTPSLLLGSLTDTLITGSQEEFDSLFLIADFPSTGDKEMQIAKWLFDNYSQTCDSILAIPDKGILAAANTIGFYANWKDSTRVKVLKERCEAYYGLLSVAGNKTVVNTSTYNTALAMVRALHESPATSGYFADNDPESTVQRYYQLKFKASFDSVDYRCMADLLVVIYDEKRIIPIDLKTSGHPEYQFEDSFIKWSYMIQSKLYWRIIRDNMDRDPFFKDFSLENYKFIVVNRKSLTPLVWEFPYTSHYGTLIDEEGNKYRDPFTIGKELQYYLRNRPRVPEGISVNGNNIIKALRPLE